MDIAEVRTEPYCRKGKDKKGRSTRVGPAKAWSGPIITGSGKGISDPQKKFDGHFDNCGR